MGGAGWETLIMGAFIVGFNFTNNSFEEYFDFPPPDLLPVKEEMTFTFILNIYLTMKLFKLRMAKKIRIGFTSIMVMK